MDKEYFRETQRFTQWWLWLPLGGVNALFVLGLIRQVFYGMQFGNNPMSDTMLWVFTGFLLLITLLFLLFRLDTRVTDEGISFRFFPFHRKWKRCAWSDIHHAYTKTYRPLTEYGGWGIKQGAKGYAYNVAGNKGLQIYLKDGTILLIGTQRQGDLDEVLQSMGK